MASPTLLVGVSLLLSAAYAVPTPSESSPVDLVTFDGSKTTLTFHEMNDPVMGGQSVGTFRVSHDDGTSYGVFNGSVVNVPFLKAPGFIKATTAGWLGMKHTFPDVSAMLKGSVQLTVRSSHP